MQYNPLEQRIIDIVSPVIADLGFGLVTVRLFGGEDGQTLQIMAEDPATGRLGIDDCIKISRAVGAVLDVEDPISSAYRLEVSSPGIDRPLVKIADYERYKGFEARIDRVMPDEKGQKRFAGKIQDVQGDTVVLETEQGSAMLAISDIARGKLVLNDHLIKATKALAADVPEDEIELEAQI